MAYIIHHVSYVAVSVFACFSRARCACRSSAARFSIGSTGTSPCTWWTLKTIRPTCSSSCSRSGSFRIGRTSSLRNLASRQEELNENLFFAHIQRIATRNRGPLCSWYPGWYKQSLDYLSCAQDSVYTGTQLNQHKLNPVKDFFFYVAVIGGWFEPRGFCMDTAEDCGRRLLQEILRCVAIWATFLFLLRLFFFPVPPTKWARKT